MVRHIFTTIQTRMIQLRATFIEWAHEYHHKVHPAESVSSSTWRKFLLHYNRTDPELVEVVHESLSWREFLAALSMINDTLKTYDFGTEFWLPESSPSGGQNVQLSFVFFFMTFIIFVIFFE